MKPWIAELMKKMISLGIRGDDPTFAESDTWPIFLDYIQEGEQGKINGKEPGLATIGLARLKKMSSCKIWLYSKYYGIIFLDKNPEGENDDEPLGDEQLWEEHEIFDMSWVKKKG